MAASFLEKITCSSSIAPVCTHTAKKVQALLQKQRVPILTWPPQSPDLNIIENVRGRIKTVLSRQPLHGLSSDNFWAVVQQEWDRRKRDPAIGGALHESMYVRMTTVSQCHGDVTLYYSL
ncbi:hypothetical protein HPB48_011606 [Haemaphysalis longicornis]|uniref:Tc1-like transposase DDE domain-containing protein n=1 Tax=Haemaphysalis longicornis TaxID=44386 RepID=A0A9J6G9G1_HAELO|nr:hypothetical protein HPB48_011606 [Haemaphysalis longicornis]